MKFEYVIHRNDIYALYNLVSYYIVCRLSKVSFICLKKQLLNYKIKFYSFDRQKSANLT